MLFVLRKCLIIKLVNMQSSDQVQCVFSFLFEDGNDRGLEQKRERRWRLIIIALPEGSNPAEPTTATQWKESETIPIKFNTGT